jgi:hypothetical protein
MKVLKVIFCCTLLWLLLSWIVNELIYAYVDMVELSNIIHSLYRLIKDIETEGFETKKIYNFIQRQAY